MKKLFVAPALLSVILALSGCATPPLPGNRTAYASYVGDAQSLDLATVIVAVPSDKQANGFRNLHIGFHALVNKQAESTASDGDVQMIVYRSATRLSAAILEGTLSSGPVEAKDLPALRKMLTEKAQKSFDSIFAKWTHSKAFKVEIVITSMYFTDGTVGANTSQRRWW